MVRKLPSRRGGWYSVFRRGATGWQHLFDGCNRRQWDAGLILAQLARGRREYAISGFYLEFENVADPDDPVAIPTFEAREGLEYYQALSGNRDYLRVSVLTTPLLSVASGYEDYFDSADVEQGNVLTFVGQTEGTLGVRGLTFSHSVNSKVYGMALVATPDPADRSQDRIFARAYYPEDQQVSKLASSQIAVSWKQPFLFSEE